MNSLVLAFLGDAVYELYIREQLIKKGISKVKTLQKEKIKYVSATNQVRILEFLENKGILTEEEKEIVKRGRNSHSHSNPKTDIITYKKLFKQNKILPSATMVKKDLLKKYPFYADKVHEDFVCWLSILKEIKIAYGIQVPTVIYRLTEGSKSRNKFKALKMSYNTYKVHGVGFFKRLYYTFCNGLNGLKKYSKIKTK